MKVKTIYRVFDYDYEEEWLFYNFNQAKKYYKKMIDENKNGNWRLYKDKDAKNGHISEFCVMSNNILRDE